jgi:hypothetical protein
LTSREVALKKSERTPKRPVGFDAIERFESAPAWKKWLVLAVVLVAVLCALMPDIVFENNIFAVPDAQAPMSFAAVGEKALKSGSYPLWNPYIFCGMPSYASLAFTPYVYPPSFITYFLQHILRFPEMTWLLFHYLLAGVGVYLLARWIGARPSISVLAGAAFMIMPNYLAMGANGHGSQASAVAYMPYAVLLSWRIMRGRRIVSTAGLLAIVLGFQMLRGHVQIAFYTYLLIGLLVVFEAAHLLRSGEARGVAKGLGGLVAAFVIAVGIASVLIVPVREYAAYSIRGGGGGGGLNYDYATAWSLHPKEMLTFLFPWAFGYGKATYWGAMPFTDYPNYVGLVTAIFAAFALGLARKRTTWFLVVTVLAATAVSFGRFLPILYGPMFKLVPYFNKFRVPVMVLIVQQLGLVLLMAIGLEEFLARLGGRTLPRSLDERRVRWAAIALLVLFVFVLLGSGGIKESIERSAAVRAKVEAQWLEAAASGFVKGLLATIITAAAICLAILLAVSRRILPASFVLLLGVIALIDLFITDGNVLHPERGLPGSQGIIMPNEIRKELQRPDEVVKVMQRDSTYFRLFPAPAQQLGRWSYSIYPFNDNRYMAFGIFSLGGYHAAKLKIYQDVMDEMFASFNAGVYPAAILDMLNAKYFYSVFPLFKDSPVFPLVASGENMYVYENTRACPRVFYVDTFRVLAPREALKALRAPDFDPSREVILSEAPPVAVESAEGSSARIADYRLNSITLRTHVARPCILVMSEIYYPEWHATVDGAAARILRADYCLRALALEAGDHEVRFQISSRVLRVSLIVSIVSLAVGVALPAVGGFASVKGR